MRSVVSNYVMVNVPEESAEIAGKVQAVVVDKLKGRHLEVASVALADIELAKIVLEAVERKQAKEQEKEQATGGRDRPDDQRVRCHAGEASAFDRRHRPGSTTGAATVRAGRDDRGRR